MKRFLLLFLLLVVLGGAVAGGGLWWATARWRAGGPTTEDVVVTIPRGTGLRRITAILAEAGLLAEAADRLIFPLRITLDGQASSLKAGEYAVPAGASLADLAAMLTTGAGVVHYPLTVPEGLTTADILRLVRAMPELEGDVTLAPPEGALLPETYLFQRADSRDGALHRMMDAMDDALADLWPERDADLPLATPEEAVILASIVEKETAVAAERPRVAAVFINRLRLGMPLQSDPTVIYGLAPETGRLDRPLLLKDLRADHPYNTYTRGGLPPGPIANPGRESLAAVLHPAETRDLYFVADGSGGHAFAETLDEHNRNVAAWRRLRGGP
jgi:UPF0755 protein